MKKFLTVLVLLCLLPVVYLIRNHMDYGGAMPLDLPASIPVVEGQVMSGRRTLFEDGKGYVIDIRTQLPLNDVLEFYTERFDIDRLAQAPGMGAESYVADMHLADMRILLEIHSREATTYVTMAIHLEKWW